MNTMHARAWPWPGRRIALVLVSVLVGMGNAALPASYAHEVPRGAVTSVIVREASGAADEPETLVASLGGTVAVQLPLIGGFSADVPSDSLSRLEASPFVDAVTPNASLDLSGAGWEDASTIGSVMEHPGYLSQVVKSIGAHNFWSTSTGGGVDIALIDSGVAPVNGLTVPGKVVNGPDLSFESQYDNLRYLDTFGHGTHMAGIMAGRDDEATGNYNSLDQSVFVGVAPDARIVSIKVADAHGVTDVSQVIAAIDWVIQHKNDGGLNIRVLNLSFGTDSAQSYVLDPLAYAAEQAWHAGIVVVVAAGNDGNEFALRNPATDPYVIAVGAVDENGTQGKSDDFVPAFSNCGTSSRSVDLVASGRSIVSLRAPGSYADAENPGAVVGERLFVGSGTSQAAAVISGAAALLVGANPDWTPDQVKAALTGTAIPLTSTEPLCSGAGVTDLVRAGTSNPNKMKSHQKYDLALGAGTLEASRGSDHVSAEGVVLEGEVDIMGSPWNGFGTLVTRCWKEGKGKFAVTVCDEFLESTGTLWSGGDWNGATWSGSDWSGLSWTDATWSGATWSGLSWTGLSWSGATWSGATWSGATWSGLSWSGATWSGATWSGLSWLGFTWT